METEEKVDFLFLILAIIAIALLVGISGYDGGKKGRTDIQTQAIHHGYGTYDKNGKFQWVIKE